jgi:uncharacterized protein (TIGR03437 family)
LRTINAGEGGFWDDLTANLPDAAAAHDVVADREAGAVYLATDRGVYLAHEDLEAAGPAANWTLVSGNLPAARATAVELDRSKSQLYIAVEGYGVYAAPAPHRAQTLRLVNAADFSTRPAAPGSLVSVLGGAVRSVRAGDLEFPILDSSGGSTQIQIPFEVNGPTVGLSLDAASGRISVGLAVQPASPAIFVDRDGAPIVLDADTGLMLDSATTAHSNSRIQILATGLGRVTPQWATGLAAPLENPPAVQANVRAFLDRAPVQVTRATLAPATWASITVELQLPALVNASRGFYISADGQREQPGSRLPGTLSQRWRKSKRTQNRKAACLERLLVVNVGRVVRFDSRSRLAIPGLHLELYLRAFIQTAIPFAWMAEKCTNTSSPLGAG